MAQNGARPFYNIRLKYLLWTLMAMATLSVLFYSEVPLLQQAEERTRLHALRWILIPHALAGTLALLAGPGQFSRRLRARHARLHRILGRCYAGCVFMAAPLAMLSVADAQYPRAVYFRIAIVIQAGCWVMTTAAGLIAAIKLRFQQHRDWMVRSYAVTFSFIMTRVLQPIPAWNRLGRLGFASAIVCITLSAILTPQIHRWLRSRRELAAC